VLTADFSLIINLRQQDDERKKRLVRQKVQHSCLIEYERIIMKHYKH